MWRRHGHVEFPWRCQDVDSTSATFDILQSGETILPSP